MLSINELPNELLVRILRHLSLKERIISEIVCKRWKKIIEDLDEKCIAITVGNVYFYNYKVVEKYKCNDVTHYCTRNRLSVNCVENACKAVRRFQDLKSVVIETNHFDDLRPILVTLSENCDEMEHIEFKCNEGVLTEQMMAVITKAVGPKLQHFIVINQYRHFFNFAFGNQAIQSFFEKCPNLETLVLDQKTWVDFEEIEHLPRKVNNLFVPWIPFTENALNRHSVQISKMKSLEIGFIDDIVLHRICEMCNLSKFLVRQLNIDSPQSLLSLCKLTSLQTLQIHFKDYKPIIDDQLTEICKCCPLKQILLYGVHITDKFILNLCEACPDLRVLEIDFGKREITDSSVYALSCLEKLRCLSIPFTDITDEAVCYLISKCTFLTYLNLSGCQLSNIVFEKLSLKADTYKSELFTLGIINPLLYESCCKPLNLRILNRDTIFLKK